MTITADKSLLLSHTSLEIKYKAHSRRRHFRDSNRIFSSMPPYGEFEGSLLTRRDEMLDISRQKMPLFQIHEWDIFKGLGMFKWVMR